MICPNCGNDMTQSHAGFLCLHCGHIESSGASIANAPIATGKDGHDQMRAAAQDGTTPPTSEAEPPADDSTKSADAEVKSTDDAPKPAEESQPADAEPKPDDAAAPAPAPADKPLWADDDPTTPAEDAAPSGETPPPPPTIAPVWDTAPAGDTEAKPAETTPAESLDDPAKADAAVPAADLEATIKAVAEVAAVEPDAIKGETKDDQPADETKPADDAPADEAPKDESAKPEATDDSAAPTESVPSIVNHPTSADSEKPQEADSTDTEKADAGEDKPAADEGKDDAATDAPKADEAKAEEPKDKGEHTVERKENHKRRHHKHRADADEKAATDKSTEPSGDIADAAATVAAPAAAATEEAKPADTTEESKPANADAAPATPPADIQAAVNAAIEGASTDTATDPTSAESNTATDPATPDAPTEPEAADAIKSVDTEADAPSADASTPAPDDQPASEAADGTEKAESEATSEPAGTSDQPTDASAPDAPEDPATAAETTADKEAGLTPTDAAELIGDQPKDEADAAKAEPVTDSPATGMTTPPSGPDAATTPTVPDTPATPAPEADTTSSPSEAAPTPVPAPFEAATPPAPVASTAPVASMAPAAAAPDMADGAPKPPLTPVTHPGSMRAGAIVGVVFAVLAIGLAGAATYVNFVAPSHALGAYMQHIAASKTASINGALSHTGSVYRYSVKLTGKGDVSNIADARLDLHASGVLAKGSVDAAAANSGNIALHFVTAASTLFLQADSVTREDIMPTKLGAGWYKDDATQGDLLGCAARRASVLSDVPVKDAKFAGFDLLSGRRALKFTGTVDYAQLKKAFTKANTSLPSNCKFTTADDQFTGRTATYEVWRGLGIDRLKVTYTNRTAGTTNDLQLDTSDYGKKVTIAAPSDSATDLKAELERILGANVLAAEAEAPAAAPVATPEPAPANPRDDQRRAALTQAAAVATAFMPTNHGLAPKSTATLQARLKLTDPTTAKPYQIIATTPTAVGQMQYVRSSQCVNNLSAPVTPASNKLFSVTTLLEDGTTACVDNH
jgi:hypothetical protein